MPLDHRDGHHHIAGDAEGGDAAEEPEEQADAAEEFGADGKECERGGNVRLLSKKTHSPWEAVATEPAESLLSAMGEKNDAENQAKNSDGEIVGSVHQPAEHERASLSLVEKMGPPGNGDVTPISPYTGRENG